MAIIPGCLPEDGGSIPLDPALNTEVTMNPMQFLDFVGKVDVIRYDDGSVGFRPLTDGYPDFGGPNWGKAVENGVRKFKKAGLIS